MARRLLLSVFVGLLAVLVAGCARETSDEQVAEEILARFPADDVDGLVEMSPAEYDADVSSDGRGSLRISAAEPMTVALYETGDLDVEGATLAYRAQVRCADLDGSAYLEMWCLFDELGEFFSRSVDSPISGTTDWSVRETPFFLEARQNPTNVRLNLVVDGTGTVWVDDIRMVKAPLP